MAGSRFEKHRAERGDRNAQKEKQTPGKHEEQSILKLQIFYYIEKKIRLFFKVLG